MISHTSFWDRQFCASHARQSAVVPAKKVFTSHPRLRPENLQVVLVVHHAEDVPEWIDHGCRDESGSALDRLLVPCGAHGHQPLEAGPDIVHVPVDHRAAGLVRPALYSESAVDDAELVLEVADTELDIRGRSLDRAHEVRL